MSKVMKLCSFIHIVNIEKDHYMQICREGNDWIETDSTSII